MQCFLDCPKWDDHQWSILRPLRLTDSLQIGWFLGFWRVSSTRPRGWKIWIGKKYKKIDPLVSGFWSCLMSISLLRPGSPPISTFLSTATLPWVPGSPGLVFPERTFNATQHLQKRMVCGAIYVKTPLTLALAECSRLQKWLAIELLPLRATLHNIGPNGQRLVLVLLVRPNRGVPCNPHRPQVGRDVILANDDWYQHPWRISSPTTTQNLLRIFMNLLKLYCHLYFPSETFRELKRSIRLPQNPRISK